MYAKRPDPINDENVKEVPKCPVCGHASYSRSGIHPQCSRQQADEERMVAVKAQRESSDTKKPEKPSSTIKPWHKVCPKCRTQVHVRRNDCDCGHRFSNREPG